MRRTGCGTLDASKSQWVHASDIGAVHLRDAPHILLPRLQLVFLQPPAHRFA
jgi:hypothetical protein